MAKYKESKLENMQDTPTEGTSNVYNSGVLYNSGRTITEPASVGEEVSTISSGSGVTDYSAGHIVKSANFVTGSSGWKIDGQGNAEFQSMTIGDTTSDIFLTYDADTGELIVNRTKLTNEDKYGDGSDGDTTISGNTTLTTDMYYNDLTVNSGVTLNTGGYRIFVKGLLTNNGTIARNGTNGSNGANGNNNVGGAGGAGAAAIAAGSIPGGIAGVQGGDGSDGFNGGGSNPYTTDPGDTGTSAAKSAGSSISGNSGGGGTGGGWPGGGYNGAAGSAAGANGGKTGTVYNTIKNVTHALNFVDFTPSLTFLTSSPSPGGAGAGGGGAGSGGSGSGGGGGGGGSASSGGVVIICAKRINNSAIGIIQANGGDGGDGGNGANATSGNSGGGGGGGAAKGGTGGVVILIYSELTNTGTIEAAGGTGGSVGTGGTGFGDGVAGSNGNSSAAGTAGNIIQLEV